MDEVSGVAVVFGGAFCLTRGFRGWRRGMRGVVAALRRVRFFVSRRTTGGGVLCFSLGSRLRGNDEPCGNDGGVRGGIPRGRYASAPRRRAFGLRERGIWRVKSPGRYLVRSLRVNDLGFAPPP